MKDPFHVSKDELLKWLDDHAKDFEDKLNKLEVGIGNSTGFVIQKLKDLVEKHHS